MSQIIYSYNKTATLNGKFDYEKIDLELRANSFNDYVEYRPWGDTIQFTFDVELDVANKTQLDAVVSGHDGEPAEAYNDAKVDERMYQIRKLTAMAIYNPVLDDVETARYLTSIDDELNGFVKSGISVPLTEKIYIDSQAGNYQAFLNTIVNDEGNTAWQYLIVSIDPSFFT